MANSTDECNEGVPCGSRSRKRRSGAERRWTTTSESDDSEKNQPTRDATLRPSTDPSARKRRSRAERRWTTTSESDDSEKNQPTRDATLRPSTDPSARSSRIQESSRGSKSVHQIRKSVHRTRNPSSRSSRISKRRFLRSAVHLKPQRHHRPFFLLSRSARLLISGLSNGTTDEDVAIMFANYGERQSVRVHFNGHGTCAGTAEVRLQRVSLARQAQMELNDRYMIRGRRIHVQHISKIPEVYYKRLFH